MSGTYCPKCPCESCERARAWITDSMRPVTVPVIQQQPVIFQRDISEPECAYERIAREYAARGEVMPTSMLLYCPCRRCVRITC